MKIELKQILYPTDFSELSLKALQYAISFAEAYSARLHCVHVIDEAYQQWMSLGPESVPVGPGVQELLPLAQERLQRFAGQYFAGLSQPALVSALAGNPYLEIVAYAQRNDIDLIVMATHGRGGLRHALLGSLAEKVVRRSPCPVLTVRDPEHDFIKPS